MPRSRGRGRTGAAEPGRRRACETRTDAARPRFEPDVSAGAWIAPRLAPCGSGVSSIVPSGYGAYARIWHRDQEHPEFGSALTPDYLEVLRELLGAGGDHGRCWFALCEGYGRVPNGDFILPNGDFILPNGDFILFTGPLPAAMRV